MSMLCNQPPLIFGPPAPDRFSLRGIRFFAPTDDEGAGGGSGSDDDKSDKKDDDKGGGDKSSSGDGEKTFTQAELDKIVADRVARAKKSAEKSSEKQDDKGGSEGDKPKVLTQADVDAAIAAALAGKDKELAVERAGDALDKALEGRVYSASAVRKLDLEQFVNEDGKTVDTKKLNEWVEKNTTEGEKPRRRDPSQGGGSATSTGGSVSAGRELFDNEKNKSKKQKE